MELSKRIVLEGTINTRDLGGFKTKDGRRVKYGRLIRSDLLCRLTENDIKYFREVLNLKYVVDLRSYSELKKIQDKEISGATFKHIPLQADLDEKLPERGIPEHIQIKDKDVRGTARYIYNLSETCEIDEEFERIYLPLTNEKFAHDHLHEIFTLFDQNRDGAILFHCLDGKDRTGIVAALTLYLLGVDMEDIEHDYLMTNEYVKGKADAREKHLREECNINDENLIKAIRTVAGVRVNWLRAALKEIEKLGGYEAYFKDHLHITDAMIESLKDNYLE